MTPDTNALPLSKKILFSLLPSVLLLLVLALLEAGIRLFSPDPNPFVTRLSYAGTEWEQINRGYLRKYFPSTISVLPELKPSLFRAAKSSGTFRVVCLGGSTMFGTPYQMTTNIPGIVRTQLRHLYPQRDIEVINLGASAINTNVIRDLVREQVLGLHPDLVLIYAGHNEFYGPDGVGASGLQKQFPSLTRIKYHLQNLRIFQWLAGIFSSSSKSDHNLMREVSRQSQVRAGSDETRRIIGQLSSNLRTIVHDFKSAGTPVILSDIASNLLFPPFASDSMVAGIPVNESAFRALARNRRWQELEDTTATLLRLDSTNAVIQYWFGRAAYELNDTSTALSHLKIAKDLDLLKFRAPETINDVIRTVAKDEWIPCLSTDSLFAAVSHGGIPGENLFWEHLHPTALGYYDIGCLFVHEIVREQLLGPASISSLLPFDADSLDLPWLDYAYADLSMKHLTSQWPFEHYEIQPVVLDRSDSILASIAEAVYSLRTTWDEGCEATAERFRQLGQPQHALATYRALLQEFPPDAAVHYQIGTLSRDLGDVQHAVDEFNQVLKADSSNVNALVELGLLEINRGNLDRSIGLFESALRSRIPLSSATLATIHYGLAGALANKGQIESALQHLGQALVLNPRYQAAQRLRRALEQFQRSLQRH